MSLISEYTLLAGNKIGKPSLEIFDIGLFFLDKQLFRAHQPQPWESGKIKMDEELVKTEKQEKTKDAKVTRGDND
jgi:hypothetical protein